MSRTVVATIVKTITLEDDYTDKSDEEIMEMFSDGVEDYSMDDWCWDDKSVTIEVLPTDQVILGEEIYHET